MSRASLELISLWTQHVPSGSRQTPHPRFLTISPGTGAGADGKGPARPGLKGALVLVTGARDFRACGA